jgi:hypothetical protein
MSLRKKKALKSKWDEMIDEFRALGGVADNIEQRCGALGRGLFPVDPKKPVRIVVPEKLLINAKEVAFENGLLRVKKGASVSERERVFFEYYQNEFSWGSGGKSDCEEFFDRVDALPENVRNVLVKDLGLARLGASNKSDGRTQVRFLRSRMINYGNDHVLMPVLELANHGVNGCPYNFKDGISIDRIFKDEALVHYGMVDPYGAFENWGFASNEPVAFSLPATLTLGSRPLAILRQLSNKKVRGNFRIPVLDTDETKVRISYLMLGHARFPRLSKGIFYKLMKDLGEPRAEAIFDEIRRFNIQQFLKLMEALDEHQGHMISTLRRLCRHQISAITHSIGTREI